MDATEFEEAIGVDSGSSNANARIAIRDVVANRELIRGLDLAGDAPLTSDAFGLVEKDGRLELRPPGESAVAGIRSIFPPDAAGSSRGRNPLVRAFGKRRGTLFDLTAGFGADAYRLAESGHRVFACERNPAVFAVLASGWARDCELGRVPSEISARLEFSHAEGLDMLVRIDQPNIGVYLDPMYPEARRTRALPRRELQVLRQLLDREGDVIPLLEGARARAARVVVKRPHRAAPLMPGATFEVETKLVRFDVYLNPRNNVEVEA